MKKYFCYVIFLVFSAIAMQQEKAIFHTIDNVPHWLQLSKNLNAINHDAQLKISDTYPNLSYFYDKQKQLFFATSSAIPAKLPYTIISADDNTQNSIISFNFTGNDNKQVAVSFPSPLKEGENVIIGPNNSNHIIINNILFDLNNNISHELNFKETEKPVALHHSDKVICTYFIFIGENPIGLRIHDCIHNPNNFFVTSFEKSEFSPYLDRVFFGPNKNELFLRTLENQINLYKITNQNAKKVPGFITDKNMKLCDYFCDSENGNIITFCDNDNKAKENNDKNHDQISYCWSQFDDQVYVNNDFNKSVLLAPYFYIGSPYLIPRLINNQGSEINESDHHSPLPTHRGYILPAKKITTQEFFLQQMHALVLFNALTQLATQKYSEQEEQQFVNLMRAHPDKYKILLHAKFLPHEQQEKVNNFLKKLQEKYH